MTMSEPARYQENVSLFVVNDHDNDSFWREACEKFVSQVVMPFSGTFLCIGGPPTAELFDSIVSTTDCAANHMMVRIQYVGDIMALTIQGDEGREGIPAMETALLHTT